MTSSQKYQIYNPPTVMNIICTSKSSFIEINYYKKCFYMIISDDFAKNRASVYGTICSTFRFELRLYIVNNSEAFNVIKA